MIYFIRMMLTILLGAASMVFLLNAIGSHIEANADVEFLRHRAEQYGRARDDAAVTVSVMARQQNLGMLYGVAALFLVLAGTAFIMLDEGRDMVESSGPRVIEPEDC